MKRKIIRIFIILAICLVGFFGYKVYDFLTFSWLGNGCGTDDGPFTALHIAPIKLSDSIQTFDLADNRQLILENRNDTLSPILTLIQNGKVKWTLDTDTRNTEGYENTRIWKISNVTITNDTDRIELNFLGHWTYGAEAGSMEIVRDNGENTFCLSW